MATKKPAPKPATKPAPQRPPPLTQERLKELEIFNKMRRGEQLTPEERRAYQLKQRSQVPKPLPEQGTIGAVPPTQERLKELEIFNKMRRGEQLTPEERRAYQLKQRSQVPLPRPEFRSPIDMVRDPNYDIVMAQRNYENNLAQSIANSQLQNTPPPPPTDPATQFGRPRPVAPIIPIPQNPQMETYNNLLQQGIQRSNTMNQDAASNFANMQAGAPTTQPAIPSPQLGGRIRPTKGLPRSRKSKSFGSSIGRFGSPIGRFA
jgi:hypothetical protein